MTRRRALAAAFPLVLSLSCLVPAPVSAEPSSAWRTRATGLDTEGRCTRRAFHALKTAELAASASGNTGVAGRNAAIIVYVLCENNGSRAIIFCASDRPNSVNYTAKVCDTVSRFMVP